MADGSLALDEDIPTPYENGKKEEFVMDFSRHYPKWQERYSPYGKKDGLIWVKETFAHTEQLAINPEDENFGYVYKADGQPWESYEGWKWKPSIFMPKDAARIWLRITDVYPERLQDISTADIKQEGVRVPISEDGNILWSLTGKYPTYMLVDKIANSTEKRNDDLAMFVHWAELWMNINGQESWNSNPWVWVVKFEVVSKNGKPLNL